MVIHFIQRYEICNSITNASTSQRLNNSTTQAFAALRLAKQQQTTQLIHTFLSGGLPERHTRYDMGLLRPAARDSQ